MRYSDIGVKRQLILCRNPRMVGMARLRRPRRVQRRNVLG
jgi:hypothetical protein